MTNPMRDPTPWAWLERFRPRIAGGRCACGARWIMLVEALRCSAPACLRARYHRAIRSRAWVVGPTLGLRLVSRFADAQLPREFQLRGQLPPRSCNSAPKRSMLFNRAQFFAPNTTFGTSSFGVVPGGLPARSIQLGMKLYWYWLSGRERRCACWRFPKGSCRSDCYAKDTCPSGGPGCFIRQTGGKAALFPGRLGRGYGPPFAGVLHRDPSRK
jgi:hypothetical protein